MAEGNNFKYKYPGYLANNETVTSAKLNSIVSAINTLIENLMNHDHIGVTDSYNQTTRGPKLVGDACLVEKTITTRCLNDDAVTTIKILNQNITTDKIKDLNVTTNKIANNAIITNKILDKNVTREKLDDNVIDFSKIDSNTLNSIYNTMFDMIYPIGCTYITVKTYCDLPRGTWRLIETAKSRVLQVASSPDKAGTTIEAGLPDHVHAVRYNQGGGGGTGGGDLNAQRPDRDVYWRDSKPASVSNPIYGKSDTVQPPAFLINIYERIE